MSNPFDAFANWDDVKSGILPVGDAGKNLTAIVKDSGVMRPDSSQTDFVFFDLYFPEFQVEKTAKFAATASEGSIRMIKSTLEKLGLDTTDRHKILAEIERTKGWTISVTHYESEDKKKPGTIYQNFRINGVIDRGTEIPF